MPTEILHGLYDGGVGAGLADYWQAIETSPFGAGMFIWDFADEGVVRTDQGGRVDVFSTFAPDGIVGPHFEKEASYYTVRDVWSPVQIEAPKFAGGYEGALTVHNRYDFTLLAACSFNWKLVRFDGAEKTLASGSATAPVVPPHGDGQLALALPASWREADALVVTVLDPSGAELWTSSWPTPGLASRTAAAVAQNAGGVVATRKSATEIQLSAGNVTATFDAASGLLREVRRGDKIFALSNGPRLAFARPPSAGPIEWLPLAAANPEPANPTHTLVAPHVASEVEVDFDGLRGVAFVALKIELSPDGTTWKTIFDSSRRGGDGNRFNFSPQLVAAVRVSNTHNERAVPVPVKAVKVGYAAARFPVSPSTPAVVSTEGGGLEITGGASGLDRLRWSLRTDGSLRLDYAYSLAGDFAYHGITFDHAEAQMERLTWLGEGPYRVWQNRLRGATLGIHTIARNDIQPGESFGYPEFQGYFAGLRWAKLNTSAGVLTITSPSPEIFLRVGTPRISHPNTTVDFPAGDLSFLHAIPAIGSKFKTPEVSGPSGAWARAAGRYEGTLVFRFDP
jgi:hypothetical protein